MTTQMSSREFALIGATALVHDMTVVTRDLKDFQCFDELDVIDPWS